MADDDASVLSLRGLVHRFDGRPVLDIDRWSVARGGHCLIEGPSGSGKSTLL
ncbi:MAG: ABC transporter ATP-binding protein, partial [Rhizobiales bacterium]|nr:ABC transporter ATP-binding protein [Hyphomicrobiales bacterium]